MSDVDPVSCLAVALRALLDRYPNSRIGDLALWNLSRVSSLAA